MNIDLVVIELLHADGRTGNANKHFLLQRFEANPPRINYSCVYITKRDRQFKIYVKCCIFILVTLSCGHRFPLSVLAMSHLAMKMKKQRNPNY
jgi:hypothetical protein